MVETKSLQRFPALLLKKRISSAFTAGPYLPNSSRPKHNARSVRAASGAAQKAKSDMSAAMHCVHQRFGRKALAVGIEPTELTDLGTKIAFTRVPDASELEE